MTVIYPLLGMLLGAVIGAFGGTLVATLGAVAGCIAGLLFGSVVSSVRRPRPGAPTAADARRILCIPKGQVATTTFVRDAETGAWLDVESCTLCSPENEVTCRKNCLLLVRDTVPKSTPIAATPAGTAP